jgi:hypothetical protein
MFNGLLALLIFPCLPDDRPKLFGQITYYKLAPPRGRPDGATWAPWAERLVPFSVEVNACICMLHCLLGLLTMPRPPPDERPLDRGLQHHKEPA